MKLTELSNGIGNHRATPIIALGANFSIQLQGVLPSFLNKSSREIRLVGSELGRTRQSNELSQTSASISSQQKASLLQVNGAACSAPGVGFDLLTKSLSKRAARTHLI